MAAADTTDDAASTDDVLARAEGLHAEGSTVAAVDLLAEAAVGDPDVRILHRLLELRHAAAVARSSRPATAAVPSPTAADPFPEVVGEPPAITADELTGSLLGAAVAHHGSLLVRGLFGPAQVDRCRAAIAEVQRHRAAGEVLPGFRRWLRPWKASDLDWILRDRVWDHGGVWLADSPAATELVLRELRRSGALDAVADHLGERPLFSLQKSTLRRSTPAFRLAAWHQDGSFLGEGARAMNVWVALSPCGGDRPAPGLEVVPTRIEEILPRDGDLVASSISDATVRAAAGDQPPTCPVFDPGDALLFDERMAHRSHFAEGMTEVREAIECWFFAPTNFTEDYQSFLA